MPNLHNQPYAMALPRLGKRQWAERRGQIQNSFSELHVCECVCVCVCVCVSVCVWGAVEALGTLASPVLRHISPLGPGVEA